MLVGMVPLMVALRKFDASLLCPNVLITEPTVYRLLPILVAIAINGMCRAAFVLGLPCLRGSIIAWRVGIEDAIKHFFQSRYVGGHSDDAGVNVLEVVFLFLGEQIPLVVLLTACGLLLHNIAFEGGSLPLCLISCCNPALDLS